MNNRDLSELSLRYKHTFEVLLDFLNQYEWKAREIMLIEFQTYLSNNIWDQDVMWWESWKQQKRNVWPRVYHWLIRHQV